MIKEAGAEGRKGGGGKERNRQRQRGGRERAILRTWFLLCTVLCSSFVEALAKQASVPGLADNADRQKVVITSV